MIQQNDELIEIINNNKISEINNFTNVKKYEGQITRSN